jgi:SAM-dependent methyltransferase
MSDAAPAPSRIFDAFTAYQRTAAMKAAIELDLFTALAEGLDTAAALAARCGASARGIRSLCDRLVVDGFLQKTGGRWALDPEAAPFLDRRSPLYMGDVVAFVAGPAVTAAFTRLTDAVRRGGTALGGDGMIAPEHPAWVEFARAMRGFAGFSAELLAGVLGGAVGRRRRVLDVAAGHGMFGITLARQDPDTEVVALDWPNVLAVAEEHARAAGVGARFRTLPGSAFEVDLGTGWDLILLTNFLHHFDEPTCETFLRRVHAALAPAGRAVLLEFVPNDDRVSPPEAAAFSLVMLADTPRGDAYTRAEYERMLRAAGFGRIELHELRPSPQQVILATR